MSTSFWILTACVCLSARSLLLWLRCRSMLLLVTRQIPQGGSLLRHVATFVRTANRTVHRVCPVRPADTIDGLCMTTETDAYAALDDEGTETSVVDVKKSAEHDEKVCFYHTQPLPSGEDNFDGMDNYGNPVNPRQGSTLSVSQRKRKHNNPAEDPLETAPWANPDHTFPVQPYSYAGMAAFVLYRIDGALTLPQCSTKVEQTIVNAVLSELKLNPKDPTLPLATAVSPQTRIFQDGYNAARILTVLETDSEITALMRAEKCELDNAAIGTSSPDGTLAARTIAITVLCRSPSRALTANQLHLLDAAAHLAAQAPCANTEDDVCKGASAASQMRMAFLYGEPAKEYAARKFDHPEIEACKTSHSEILRVPCNEVCITWVEASSMEYVGDGRNNHRTRVEFAQIRHVDSALEYVDALRDAIFKIWRDNDILPSSPMRLLGSYANCPFPPTGAYARHRLSSTQAFWNRLEPCLEAELSPYVTDNPRYCGSLQWSRMYAKVVLRNTKLDDPNTSHGIIVHQYGFSTQASEFIQRVRHEEEQNHAKPPIGLREPMDTTEDANCMHLLFASAGECYLAPDLTCFGLRSVAGESFGYKLPSLTWRLVPLTKTLKERVYILPCHKKSIYNAQRETNYPLTDSTERAASAYCHLFPKTSSLEEASDRLSPLPEFVTREPTPREAAITTLMGLPQTCKAFRIGDVANALRSLTSNSAPGADVPGCLASFYIAAAASLGSEDSVENAFGWASTNAEYVVELEETNGKLKRKVEELELALKVAKAISPTPNVATASEEATTGVTASETVTNDSPLPPTDGNPTELDADRLAKVLGSWSRSADFSGALCYTLKSPIQGKSTRMILASLATAAPEVDESVQQATYEWTKTNCCKKSMGDCDRIARTCHHALTLSGKKTNDHRRAFVVCTSKTADAVTTVIDIDLDKPTGDDCWKTINWSADDGWGCSDGVARRAVVLAWFADERGLAVLPVCDAPENDNR